MKKFLHTFKFLCFIFIIFNASFASDDQNQIKVTSKNKKEALTKNNDTKKLLLYKKIKIDLDLKNKLNKNKIQNKMDPEFSKKLNNAIEKEQQSKNYAAAIKATVLTGGMFTGAFYLTQKTMLKNDTSCEQTNSFYSPKILFGIGCTIALVGTLLYRQLYVNKKQDENPYDLEELTKSSQNITTTLHHYQKDLDSCQKDLDLLKITINKKNLSLYELISKQNNSFTYQPLALDHLIDKKNDAQTTTPTQNFVIPTLFAGTGLLSQNFNFSRQKNAQHRPFDAIAADSVAGSLINLFVNNIAPTVITTAFWYLAYREFKKIFSAEERANVIALREHIDHSLQQVDRKFLVCFNNFKRIDDAIKNLKQHVDNEAEKYNNLLQNQAELQNNTHNQLTEVLKKLEQAQKDYANMTKQLHKILPKMSEISENTQALAQTVKPLKRIEGYELTVLQLQKKIQEKSDNPSTVKRKRKGSSCCSTNLDDVVNPSDKNIEHKED